MDNGWIKIHRKIKEWEWYSDPNTFRLFFHLLISANHSDQRWKGIDIKRGQMLTGRIKLADETGLTQQQVRSSLNKLKSTSELTIKPTNKYSIITLNNYDTYQQSNQLATQRATNKQPTSNHKQECKEGKERKEIGRFKNPELSEVIAYFEEKFSSEKEAHLFYSFYESNGWKVGKNKMQKWKSAASGWIKRNDKGGGSTLEQELQKIGNHAFTVKYGQKKFGETFNKLHKL